MKALWLLAAVAAASLFPGLAQARSPIEAGPGNLKKVRLLGEAIKEAKASGRAVHIVYVHGMRAEEPGASSFMREALQKHLDIPAQGRTARCFVKLGEPQLKAKWVNELIWRNEQEWLASRPFIDRFELRGNGSTILVDEVNWWPLLFPLKCRFLVDPEHDLSGLDVAHINLCSSGVPDGRQEGCDGESPIYYPWIPPARRDELLASSPRAGRGSWPNAPVKRQIMNWGLSDAVIALGPMRPYISSSLDQAFDLVTRDVPANAVRIVVSESLGSFVVLDAANLREPNVEKFINETGDFYFFANQFSLLELARISGLSSQPELKKPAGGESIVLGAQSSSVLGVLSKSPTGPEGIAPEMVRPRQVIAFSDPSDMLTWPVPPIKDVEVVNLYDRQSGGPFRLFANPVKAHRGAIEDPTIWKWLLQER